FFFQAEDGIRDSSVTGVQTCALPISFSRRFCPKRRTRERIVKIRAIEPGVTMVVFLYILLNRVCVHMWFVDRWALNAVNCASSTEWVVSTHISKPDALCVSHLPCV